ncbi:MAG: hypothetical protein ACLQNE_21100 [Thermoguttaceae bacterium]
MPSLYPIPTTFGSRVADGVYETLLDGMELEELRDHEKIDDERDGLANRPVGVIRDVPPTNHWPT